MALSLHARYVKWLSASFMLAVPHQYLPHLCELKKPSLLVSQVMRDPEGVSRGSGFVAFSTSEEASRAVSLANLSRFTMIKLENMFCFGILDFFLLFVAFGYEWQNGC